MSRRSWVSDAALLAAFLGGALYADPRGPFSLNDDFVFSNSARRFLASGRLQLSQWQLPANIPHVAAGALYGLFAAPSNEHLRLFNLTLGALCAAVFLRFLMYLGIKPLRALAGAALLAACPLYLALSMSFHAEINSLLLQTLGLWLLILGLRGRSLIPLALASLSLGLFALNRQSCILAVAGAAGFLAQKRKLSRDTFLALLLPAGLLFVGYLLWFHFIHGPTWAWLAQKHTPSLNPVKWLDPALPLEFLLRVNACAQSASCFLIPLSLGLAPAMSRWRRPRKNEAFILAAVSALAVLGWTYSGGMPLLENWLSRKGLGVITLNNVEAKAAGPWENLLIWKAIDLLSLLSSLALVRLFFARALSAGREASALLWTSLPPFLVLLILPHFYDRYLLIILPSTIAAALLALGEESFSTPLCLGACLILGFLSCVGLKDYFAWNRARWEAGLYGVSLGLRPEQIENGFDWDGQFSLDKNMEKLLARKRPWEIDVWDWEAENRIVMLTSFSAKPPRGDFTLARKFGYATPLSAKTEYVYLYGYMPASKRRI